MNSSKGEKNLKQDNHSLSFDVSEMLYFETGQEIDEMLSISLDPDIAIQTYDDYIQIRGIVLLQGEYKKADVPNDSVSLATGEVTTFVEKVYELDDDRSKFSHRFPVEISIPPSLVDNLNDITVSVEAFDYELPDQNKLNIHASIQINGINDAQSMNVSNETLPTEDLEESSENHASNEWTESGTFHEDVSNVETEEYVASEQTNEVASEMYEESLHDEMLTEQQSLDLAHDEEDTEEGGIDIQLSESTDDEDNESVTNVQFLTDLFGGEEESYTKMRIYITQEDDSIESIAKKYEMSALQLMKDNQISDESLEEGQLLYIPVKVDGNNNAQN